MESDPEDLESLLEQDVDIEDIEEEDYLGEYEECEPIESEEPVPYNEWSAEVDKHIGLITNSTETIETVGFETWFWNWWREGIVPEEAAVLGVVENLSFVY